jgi:hypothetical protein
VSRRGVTARLNRVARSGDVGRLEVLLASGVVSVGDVGGSVGFVDLALKCGSFGVLRRAVELGVVFPVFRPVVDGYGSFRELSREQLPFVRSVVLGDRVGLVRDFGLLGGGWGDFVGGLLRSCAVRAFALALRERKYDFVDVFVDGGVSLGSLGEFGMLNGVERVTELVCVARGGGVVPRAVGGLVSLGGYADWLDGLVVGSGVVDVSLVYGLACDVALGEGADVEFVVFLAGRLLGACGDVSSVVHLVRVRELVDGVVKFGRFDVVDGLVAGGFSGVLSVVLDAPAFGGVGEGWWEVRERVLGCG